MSSAHSESGRNSSGSPPAIFTLRDGSRSPLSTHARISAVANGPCISPSSSMWWWQHGANFTEEGTLLVSTRSSEEGTETLVREYLLDEDTETLVEAWQFGTGEGIYGSTLGEAHRLPGGNTLHNYGSHARMREITPEGDLVWELWLGGDDQYLGRSTPLADLYAFVP